jgi:hypothetical protein
MGTILFAVVSIFAFRFRSRSSLELKLIALQHQLAVLRRQRPGRPQLSSAARCCTTTRSGIAPPASRASSREAGIAPFPRHRCEQPLALDLQDVGH